MATTTVTVTVEDVDGNSGSDRGGDAGEQRRCCRHVSWSLTGFTNALGVFSTTLSSTTGAAHRHHHRERRRGSRNTRRWTSRPGAASAATSSVVASPATVAADGAATTTVTVTVEDADGNLVPNAAVTLASSGGAADTFGSTTGFTNALGVFSTTLSSTTAQPTDTITASEGGVHETTAVDFTAGAASAATSSVVASPATVAADGVATTTVTVTVEDAHGNLVPNAAVTLASSGGAADTFGSTTGFTNALGVFSTTLSSTTAQPTDTITASEGGVHETMAVDFTAGAASAATSSVVASPATVAADGVATTTVTVTVEDAHGNLVPNAAVTLASSGGAADTFGSTTGFTNALGVFSTTLSSTTAQPTDTITASEGGVHETTAVDFTAGAASAATSSVVASPATVAADGVATTTVTVTVEDAHGNLVPNAAVTLASSGGAADTFGSTTGFTNALGVFSTTLSSTTAQPTDTITASEGGVHETTAVDFTAGAASAATSSVVASPATVAADGVATTTVTVTVEDAHGNLVPNAAVTLASSGGAADTFGSTTGFTNALGVFSTTLSSTTAQPTDTITASEGGVHETTAVDFTAGAASAATSSVVASPATVAADGVATTTVTVTVEDAHGNLVPKCGGDAGEQRRRRRYVWVDHRLYQCAGRVQHHAVVDHGAAHRHHHRERRRAFTKPRRWTSRPGRPRRRPRAWWRARRRWRRTGWRRRR